jgi:NitT/TauT family transport system substrate-binding protein
VGGAAAIGDDGTRPAPALAWAIVMPQLRSASLCAILLWMFGLLLIAAGCRSSTEESGGDRSIAESPALPRVLVQLNWYPEAEHGGVYQAFADGTYGEQGLDVEIRPGGRASTVSAELTLGRAQFAFSNADDVVIYRRQGMDIVAVLAAMQNNPRCILVREESGAKSFDDLAGMTLQRQAGRPFLEFIRSCGILDKVKEVPYYGSVSSLVVDPNIAIQAYSFAEPLLAEQQGVTVRRLMVSDLGWNPYSSVLITSGDLIQSDPELVGQFVEATRRGWQNYLSDPAKGNQAILGANEHGMTAEALQFGSVEMRSLAMPEGMNLDSVGMMTIERWKMLVDQMDALDPHAAGKVKPEDCFSVDFL